MADFSKFTGSFTPLGIVATFVALTEVILGVGVVNTTGWIQAMLAIDFVVFSGIVFVSFIAILCTRAHVFYPPSEYKDIDPKAYAEAMVSAAVPKKMELIKQATEKPSASEAHFAAVDALIPEHIRQLIVLMNDKRTSVPMTGNVHFEYSLANGSSGRGGFMLQQFADSMNGTGLVIIDVGASVISLSVTGKQFASWLVENKRKAAYFKCDFGYWGDPAPFQAAFQRATQETT